MEDSHAVAGGVAFAGALLLIPRIEVALLGFINPRGLGRREIELLLMRSSRYSGEMAA